MKNEEVESIYKKMSQKKKSSKSGETGGERNYMTTYYSKLLKQKIKQLNKMVEWRQNNIMKLSAKKKKTKTATQEKGKVLTF
ncbi:MAG: hypothetical protein IJ837_00620 [Clostridia bacterium]|nr:hypothetical protein [Clostridia bacterium]